MPIVFLELQPQNFCLVYSDVSVTLRHHFKELIETKELEEWLLDIICCIPCVNFPRATLEKPCVLSDIVL